MGKGGGGGTAAGHMAGRFAQQLARMSGPVRKQYFGGITRALKTGVIEEKIPAIQQMVQAGLGEGSRAVREQQEQIARLPPEVGRSPAAAEQIAATRALAQRAVAAIPSEVVGAAAFEAPETLNQAANAAMGLLGQAGMMQGQAQQAAAARQATTTSTVGAGVGALIGIVAIAI